MNWPTISAGARLRISGCVPVWQKRQDSVQPTWRRNADRAAILGAVGNVDRLRLLPVAEAEQPFPRPVDRSSARWPTSGRPMTNRSASRCCSGLAIDDIREEIGDALIVDPVPELLGAERRLADRRHLRCKLGARQADQLAPPIGKLHRRRVEQRRLGEDARLAPPRSDR